MKQKCKWIKRGILALLFLGLAGMAAIYGLSSYMKIHTAEKIVTAEEAVKL